VAAGKRLSTDEPLTEHDVADRLDKAALRTLRIMMDARQISPEFFEAVKGSRYQTNVILMLRDEINLWFPITE
jgi:hypothetical protein